MNIIIILPITFRLSKKVIHSSHNDSNCVLFQVNLNDVLNTRYSDASLPRNCFHQAPRRGLHHLMSDSRIHISIQYQ